MTKMTSIDITTAITTDETVICEKFVNLFFQNFIVKTICKNALKQHSLTMCSFKRCETLKV